MEHTAVVIESGGISAVMEKDADGICFAAVYHADEWCLPVFGFGFAG